MTLAVQSSVRVVEVGLRDGLQTVDRVLDTGTKIALVHALIAAGVTEIEVASFAHPRVLPQLADAEVLLAEVPRRPDVRYRGLVPNLRGAQRAGECDLDTVVALVSCDDRVSQINQGRSTDEVLTELPLIAEVARSRGARFEVGLAMAYFAPCSGPTDPELRARMVARVVDAGAEGVYLADTVGMADPTQIASSLEQIHVAHPGLPVGLHLHARNGFALANALVALQGGVDWLECAFGGLGGDLWFPGEPDVLGNLATEDLIAFTDALGVRTGIDAQAFGVVSRMAREATGRAALDHVTRGGSARELASADWGDVLAGFSGVTTATGSST